MLASDKIRIECPKCGKPFREHFRKFAAASACHARAAKRRLRSTMHPRMTPFARHSAPPASSGNKPPAISCYGRIEKPDAHGVGLRMGWLVAVMAGASPTLQSSFSVLPA